MKWFVIENESKKNGSCWVVFHWLSMENSISTLFRISFALTSFVLWSSLFVFKFYSTKCHHLCLSSMCWLVLKCTNNNGNRNWTMKFENVCERQKKLWMIEKLANEWKRSSFVDFLLKSLCVNDFFLPFSVHLLFSVFSLYVLLLKLCGLWLVYGLDHVVRYRPA